MSSPSGFARRLTGARLDSEDLSTTFRGPFIEVSDFMNEDQLEAFRQLLLEKRESVVKRARETIEKDMQLDVADLPDEMDLASSEYMQAFTFRLRGRERAFLQKIEKALQKIETGEFGECEGCGEMIGLRRLEARPETELCIQCKEEQERQEREYL